MSAGGAGSGARPEELLRMLVALQERGQRAMATRLHDGPMQEFTAVLLELASVRRQLSGALAERVAAMEDRLRAAALELQLPPGVFRLGHDATEALIAGLRQRVDGLLVDRLDTDLRLAEYPPTDAEISAVLGAVQVLLLASNPYATGERAWLSVRSGPAGLDLSLAVCPSGHEPPTDEARAARLRPLADAIGADLCHDAEAARWTATLHLARRAAGTPTH
ncbi:histidine kinase [Candidatus Frankia nodulisporulans]|uniref:histidine kinase n=1 Tax=Candidatus Frankia nodulisporulans TaxID=2060052 RepID=UPI0013D5661F|nr:histidine kinase [Candidatus Frankia nodulisporulans]